MPSIVDLQNEIDDIKERLSNSDESLDDFIANIKSDPIKTIKFKALMDYVSDPNNYVLPVLGVILTPALNHITVSWTGSEQADSYSVYYKRSSDGFYSLVGTTLATGITIPSVQAGTEYKVYVVVNYNSKQSAPSIVATTTTLGNPPTEEA